MSKIKMSTSSHRTCEICGLKERHLKVKVQFAKFPRDQNRCKEWVRAVGQEDLVHIPIEKLSTLKTVCEYHFQKEDFKKKTHRLKMSAVPNKNLNLPPLSDEQLKDFPLRMFRHKKEWSVLGEHGYGKTADDANSSSSVMVINSKNEILHKFPNPVKDPERFRSWLYKVGGDILQMRNDVIFKYGKVCHLHFETCYHTRSKYLSANAVPTLHLSGRTTQKQPLLIGVTNAPKKQSDHTYIKSEQPSSKFARFSDAKEGANASEPVEDNQLSRQQTSAVVPCDEDSNVETNEEILDETVIEDETLVPVEEGPFSWQQASAVVPCDADIQEEEGIKEEHMLWDVLKKNVEQTKLRRDSVESIDGDDSDGHAGYCCNVCEGSIRGFRFMCVQCADYDLCSACESKALHSHHYMLRVPPNKDKDEVAEVLQRIRQAINNCIIHVNDNGEVEVKEEIEEVDDPETNIQNPIDTSIEEIDTNFDDHFDLNYENRLNVTSVEHLEKTNGLNITENHLGTVEYLDNESDVNMAEIIQYHLRSSPKKPNIEGTKLLYVENPPDVTTINTEKPLKLYEVVDPNIINRLRTSVKKPLNIEKKQEFYVENPSTVENLELYVENPSDITTEKPLELYVENSVDVTTEKTLEFYVENSLSVTTEDPLKTSSIASVVLTNPVCAKCKVTFDGSKPFHHFRRHKDTSDSSLRSWATYCWPRKDWSTVASLLTIPPDSYLCVSHFKEYCSRKSGRPRAVTLAEKKGKTRPSTSYSLDVRLPNVHQTVKQSIIITPDMYD